MGNALGGPTARLDLWTALAGEGPGLQVCVWWAGMGMGEWCSEEIWSFPQTTLVGGSAFSLPLCFPLRVTLHLSHPHDDCWHTVFSVRLAVALVCTKVLHALSDCSGGRSETPSSLSNMGHSPCPLCICWLIHETQDTPEHIGTSPWHKGLANSATRSGLEDNITAFAACHQSIQFIPPWDQHLFYSVRPLLWAIRVTGSRQSEESIWLPI